MDRRANSSRAGNDPRSSLFFIFSRDPVSFFFQTVLLSFFFSLVIRRAVIVAFEGKVGRTRLSENFFFNRISLFLPFRCFEISLSFFFFFSKEFKFTIKYFTNFDVCKCMSSLLIIESKFLHDFININSTFYYFSEQKGSLFVYIKYTIFKKEDFFNARIGVPLVARSLNYTYVIRLENIIEANIKANREATINRFHDEYSICLGNLFFFFYSFYFFFFFLDLENSCVKHF